MNSKQRKTLDQILKDPIPVNIKCSDMESLFIYLGGKIKEGNGSRACIEIYGRKLNYHRPHPSPYMQTYLVKKVRQFLIEVGV